GMAGQRNARQRSGELAAAARHHEQTEPIVLDLDLGYMILFEEQRRDPGSVTAADQILAGMLVDFLPHVADLAFGYDHAVGDEDDVAGDRAPSAETGAGEDHGRALGRKPRKQGDGPARTSGSSPLSGSSRISTSGPCPIACASRRRCRIPFE